MKVIIVFFFVFFLSLLFFFIISFMFCLDVRVFVFIRSCRFLVSILFFFSGWLFWVIMLDRFLQFSCSYLIRVSSDLLYSWLQFFRSFLFFFFCFKFVQIKFIMLLDRMFMFFFCCVMLWRSLVFFRFIFSIFS